MKKLLTLLLFYSAWLGQSQPTGTFHRDFSLSQSPFNGDSRRFSFYVPSTYDHSKQHPLIIGLHGCGSTSNHFRNTLRRIADSLDAVVACPDGNSDALTNEYGGKEVELLEILYDTVNSWYNIDVGQVYLTGFSCNGREALSIVLEQKTNVPFAGVLPYAGAFNSPNFNPSSFGRTYVTPACFCMGDQDFFYTQMNFYQQMLDSMNQRMAVYHEIIMPGVPHTTNHPNYTRYMLQCFRYLKQNTTIGLSESKNSKLFNWSIKQGNLLHIEALQNGWIDCRVSNILGQQVAQRKFNNSTVIPLTPNAVYVVSMIHQNGESKTIKVRI